MVTFQTPDYHDVSMLDNDARYLLELMGLSTTVPGAIAAGDVPAARDRLRQAVNNEPPPVSEDQDNEENDEEEPAVPLKHRALPLLELLTTAVNTQSHVMWQ